MSELKFTSFIFARSTNKNEGKVFIHPKYFERMPSTIANGEVYKCLMGCPQRFSKDGQPKYLHVSNKSRFAANRHVEVCCVNIFKMMI